MAVLKFKNPETKKWEELKVVNDGVSFFPTLDPVTNVLSWTNNGFLPNPDPISLKPRGIEMYDTKADFPSAADASEFAVYIDKTTSGMYRWVAVTKEYLPLSAAGSAMSVVFVPTVPTVDKAETGILYVVKQTNGNYEFWAKNDGEMVLIEDAAEANVKDVFYGETYHDFPTEGNPEMVYIARSTNTTYRYDDTTKKYITVGDKLMSVEAGHEADAEIDEITADDVKNAFHS